VHFPASIGFGMGAILARDRYFGISVGHPKISLSR